MSLLGGLEEDLAVEVVVRYPFERMPVGILNPFDVVSMHGLDLRPYWPSV